MSGEADGPLVVLSPSNLMRTTRLQYGARRSAWQWASPTETLACRWIRIRSTLSMRVTSGIPELQNLNMEQRGYLVEAFRNKILKVTENTKAGEGLRRSATRQQKRKSKRPKTNAGTSQRASVQSGNARTSTARIRRQEGASLSGTTPRVDSTT